MRVLAIRNYSKGFRYCIFEGDNEGFSWVNRDTENRVIIPKDQEVNDTYLWYQDEIQRIVDNHGVFDKIVFKRNENMRTTYSTLLPVVYFDCILTMVALNNDIPVTSLMYTHLGTNSENARKKAEESVLQLDKYWDVPIAEAVLVGLKTLSDGI